MAGFECGLGIENHVCFIPKLIDPGKKLVSVKEKNLETICNVLKYS